MILRCALASLCALTGAIRTVSGLQVPPRPKHIRCQRGAAPAPAPQENEGDAAPAAAPLARSEDAPPTSSNPFDALKKGFESAVQSATNNPDYKFGDLTKLIVSRASQLTMKDATMLLKALLSFNVGLSSVGGLLPIKFLVEVLNYSLLVDVGERLAGMVAVEIDKRVKEALTGDSEYKLGDLTKRAVKSFTGKEEYAFGDVSREVMRRFEEPGGADATAFGDSDGSTAIDAELAEELDRWDAKFLAARDADATA